MKKRLGEILRQRQWVDPDALDAALRRQKESEELPNGARLGTFLLEARLISVADLAAALAEQYQIPKLAMDLREITPATIREVLPPALCAELSIVPLKTEDGVVHVLMRDPADDTALNRLVEETKSVVARHVFPEAAIALLLYRLLDVPLPDRFAKIDENFLFPAEKPAENSESTEEEVPPEPKQPTGEKMVFAPTKPTTEDLPVQVDEEEFAESSPPLEAEDLEPPEDSGSIDVSDVEEPAGTQNWVSFSAPAVPTIAAPVNLPPQPVASSSAINSSTTNWVAFKKDPSQNASAAVAANNWVSFGTAQPEPKANVNSDNNDDAHIDVDIADEP